MKYNIQKTFSYVLAILIFAFVVRILVGQWSDIGNIKFNFNLFYLLLAFIFACLNIFALAFIWYLILKKIDGSLKINVDFNFDVFGFCIAAQSMTNFKPGFSRQHPVQDNKI